MPALAAQWQSQAISRRSHPTLKEERFGDAQKWFASRLYEWALSPVGVAYCAYVRKSGYTCLTRDDAHAKHLACDGWVAVNIRIHILAIHPSTTMLPNRTDPIRF